jgi:hypothetical protein
LENLQGAKLKKVKFCKLLVWWNKQVQRMKVFKRQLNNVINLLLKDRKYRELNNRMRLIIVKIPKIKWRGNIVKKKVINKMLDRGKNNKDTKVINSISMLKSILVKRVGVIINKKKMMRMIGRMWKKKNQIKENKKTI